MVSGTETAERARACSRSAVCTSTGSKPYLTPSKSCSGFCFLLWGEPTTAERHICMGEFRAPSCTAFRAASPAATSKSGFTLPSSRLQSSTLKNTYFDFFFLLFSIWELGCLSGFGKLIFFDSCPISSCTDLVPKKEPPESHFLLHISKCFSCKSFPTKSPKARKLWALRRAWFCGSLSPSLSYIW